MTAVVSLGSNLGDRLGQLRRGLSVLSMHLPIVEVSGVYETAAVGVTDQPDFLNLVATLGTSDAESAFVAAQAAETAAGRLRSRRWGPRSLDVDVIDVDGQVSEDPRLTLPHPRARERAFVLVPWLEIDPVAELPRVGSVRALVEHIAAADVRRVGDAPR
ncbi:MAG TPA: 2-amino-4-hydroxy-6-hydroxymethyldihydropteridine diphosphokinase [Mycobacteriales bacterium]|nr:2-amino-4-hydroxy-6-hydroxymethyldihydropteridine diphosphokinase [Mycobacteriales bacterium]